MAIKIDYTQTTWVNEQTPLNAQNMNNIDRALTSIKQSLDNREFTAQSVGADPSGTAVEKVAEHNESQTPHSGVLAPIVHTHNLSEITNFPANNPTAADNGKVAIVKNGAWSANKLTFSDIDGELPYADISGAPTIPTKVSDLTNDLGYVTRGEVDQPAVIEYKGGKVTTINLEFGYAPDHLVIQDFVEGGREPVATTVIDHDFSGQAQFVWGDFDVAIVTPVGGQFNVANHTYKVWGYALTSPNEVPDGDLIVAEDGQWTHTSPAQLGLTTVIANPSGTASENLTSVEIDGTVYNVVGTVDSAMSSSSTNPVQNKIIYSALSNKENSANKASNFNTLNNTKFPTTKAVSDFVAAQVSANSADTPTGTLENIKIGGDIYELPDTTQIFRITPTFASSSAERGHTSVTIPAEEATMLADMSNQDYAVVFNNDNYLNENKHVDGYAVKTKVVGDYIFFCGNIRVTDNIETMGRDTYPIEFKFNTQASSGAQIDFWVCFPDDSVSSLSQRPISGGAVYTALMIKETASNKVTSISSSSSDVQYPSAKAVYSYITPNPNATGSINLENLRIGNTTYKIPSGGSSITVDDALSNSSTNPVQNKVIQGKISSIETNLTTIDTSLSSLSDSVSAQSTAINGKQDTSNLVTSWSSTTSNSKYPSEKLVKDSIDATNTVISGLATTVGAMQDDIDDLQDDIDAIVSSGTSTIINQYAALAGYYTWVRSGKALHIKITTADAGVLAMYTSATLSMFPRVTVNSTKCVYSYLSGSTMVTGYFTISSNASDGLATISGVYDPGQPAGLNATAALANAVNIVFTVLIS